MLGLEPPAALARERSTRAYPKPVAAPRATEKLKALWWEPLDQAAYAKSFWSASRDADFEAARAALRARLPDLARDFRQEAGAARAGPPAALREEASRKDFAAPLDAKRAQQAALSLRKIQDAGLGDAARVAAALRGERGADLGLDEDALELVRRVGLPPKAADDAGERAALVAARADIDRRFQGVQTSELSSSVKSKSIRLIFGRIDCSRRGLEAQPKSPARLRSH